MRFWMLLALAVLVCVAPAGAQDADAPDAPRPLLHEAWVRTIARVRAGDATTIQKITELRDAVEGRLVEVRARVVDVRPGARDGWLRVETRSMFGGEPRRTFDVSPEHAATVTDWNRGDRVRWRYVAKVHDLDRIDVEPVYRDLRDVSYDGAGGLVTRSDDYVLSWADWHRVYQRVRGDESTTSVGAADQLREAVAGKLVQARGKIADIREDTRDGSVVVHVCGEFGGAPFREFRVRADERSVVSGWRRWDRVSWYFTVTVHALERIDTEDVYTVVDDLARSPGRGITYPDPPLPVKPLGGFEKWLKRFATDALRDRWDGAFASLERAGRSLWEVPATVRGVAGREVDVAIGGNLTASHRESRQAWGVRTSRTRVEVADPELLEALAPGVDVVLHMRIAGPVSAAELRRADGAFETTFELARLSE